LPGASWGGVSEDNLLVWGSALAYSWFFAAFPFLLFLLSLLPYLPQNVKDHASDQVHQMVYRSMPGEAADTIWMNVQDVLRQKRTGLMSVGLLLALWSASGGMSTTISALDQCYELRQGRSMLKHRLLAIGLTIVVAVLLLAVLVLLPVGAILIQRLLGRSDGPLSRGLLWTLMILRYPAALVAMFLIANIVYYFGPAVRQRFVWITPGAIFCVLVWVLLGVAVRFYIAHFGSFNQTYGIVGGAVILLMVFYFDAVVLMVGAEINSEMDFELLKVPRGARDLIVPP
jgi:membrane protein